MKYRLQRLLHSKLKSSYSKHEGNSTGLGNLNQHGYTLMELMVATLVASIIMISVMTFLVNSMANNSVRSARADLLREAQLALDVMIKDIRLAANVDTNNRIEDPNSPDAIATGGFGWISDADTLVLAAAAEDSSNNIIFTDATHYITEKNNIVYYLDSGTLYKRTLASNSPTTDFTTSCPPTIATAGCPADRLSVANVETLNFRYFDAADVEVAPGAARSVVAEISLSTTKYGRQVTVSYSTRTVFRNE